MITSQYTINYEGYILHFGIDKLYKDYWTLEALDVDGYCFNIIGTSDAHEEGTDASEGCFWSHLDYNKQTSELIDQLIMDGVMKPTGRILEAYGGPYFIEMRPVDEWMNNLFVNDHTSFIENCDKIQSYLTVTCGARWREAFIAHGDYLWTVVQRVPFLDRDDGERSYYIEVTSQKHDIDSRQGFRTKSYKSVTDAWLEAKRLEVAAEEILDCFERVAAEQGLSVDKLMDAFERCDD